MTTLTKITNHKEEELKRLLEQYKNKENLKKVLCIYADQIQEIEDLAFALYDRLSIDDSSGQQLDEIGEIVVQKRNGVSDKRYRTLLFVKIGINTSKGTPKKLTDIIQLLSNANFVHYINLNNGNFELQTDGTFVDQEEINFVFVSMARVAAGGTRMAALICYDPTEGFAYQGPNTDSPALGYANDAGTIGGKYSTLHINKTPFAYAGVDKSAEGYGAGSPDPLVGGVYV